jgi:hypothetical protein
VESTGRSAAILYDTGMSDLGDLTVWGVGLRHSISQYIESMHPVDLALALNWQNAEVENEDSQGVLQTQAVSVSVQSGVALDAMYAYGGLSIDWFEMEVNYRFEDDTEPFQLDYQYDAAFQLTLGIAYRMRGLAAYGEYNLRPEFRGGGLVAHLSLQQPEGDTMKYIWTRVIATVILGTTLGMSSCIYENGDLVVNEHVCVNLDEYQTTGTFSSFVVCDKFKDALERKLKEQNRGKKDVKSIHMVSATFKTMAVHPHDWNVTADIDIARQDVPDGPYEDGPATLVVFTNQSLKALKGRPTDATLLSDGVAVVDRALQSLLEEADPRLVLIVDNETVAPTPSPTDPMEFKVLVCVNFQMVVDLGNKKKP